jgi:predicted ATPase/class 3 adenylate cyclase
MHTAPDTAEQSLPQGRITLMFSDVEGSTAGWERHGAVFGEALRIHERIVRRCIANHSGHVVKTAGDGFMAAFSSAPAAVACAVSIQNALAAEPASGSWSAVGGLRVRIGLHVGSPSCRDNDYFGPVVNRAARIADAANGGMVLTSQDVLDSVSESLPDGAFVKNHQSHRLKDLGEPVPLYEIRHPGFQPIWNDRPLRTLESLRHNFPAQVTSLVGRSCERDELNGLLSQRHVRLITLTGPGGTGKTRLALQVAADRLQDYRDGVWLVDLSSVHDPDAVAATITHALDLSVPASGTPMSALVAFLRGRRALLVLDNFEQVSDAAPLVSELLRECANLACLVTSREILHLTGEREYPVEPLSSPPAGAREIDWSSYESVQLFVERSKSAKPEFELTAANGSAIGEICRRLDGIPLAIELAAARSRALSAPQILQRLSDRFGILSSSLRDVPARQQTLRATIDWSYDLLTQDERALFRELAVFSGGFFLEAAEAVCGTPGAFDLVFSLRDKSLLKTSEALGETRYFMLETIREYSLQRLSEMDSANSLRARHAEYFLRRALDWCDKLASAGEEADEADQVFRVDLDNMRAGMDWTAFTDRPDLTMDYGRALFAYLRRHGLGAECEERLASADSAARQTGNRKLLARLLNQRGLLAMERADLTTAQGLFEESRAISESLGDDTRVMVTSINLGSVYWMLGQFASAREQWEAALALTEATAQPRYQAFIRENLGILACQEGRLDEADDHYRAALRMHRASGNQEGIASAFYNSSEVQRERGNFAAALAGLEESHAFYSELDHQRGLALACVRIGLVLVESGAANPASARINEGMRIARTTGNRHAMLYGMVALAKLAIAEEDYDSAWSLAAQALDLASALHDRLQQAESVLVAAQVVKARGADHDEARLRFWLEGEFAEMGLNQSEQRANSARVQELVASIATNVVESLRNESASLDPREALKRS